MANPDIGREGANRSKRDAATRRANLVAPPPVEGARWIPLASGEHALVDEEDYERVMEMRWTFGVSNRRRKYVRASVGRRSVYLHRFVMNAADGEQIDHLQNDRLDNRKNQLRRATALQNGGNQKRRNGVSGFKGVYPYRSHTRPWVARFKLNGAKGRNLHLGVFETAEQAAREYDEVARFLKGEFACVNFPRTGERAARDV